MGGDGSRGVARASLDPALMDGSPLGTWGMGIENWGWGGAMKGSGDIPVADVGNAEPDFLGKR